jgi:hypothetical protein
MLNRQVGGEVAQSGIYWNIRDGEFISVPTGGGKLAGGPRDRYLKAPLPVVLVVGPLMGLAFALFLPLSGLLVLVPFLAAKLRGAVSSGKVSAAHMASPRMQPGVSYLEPRSGGATKRSSTAENAESEQEGKLIDLAKEIAEKRWQNK